MVSWRRRTRTESENFAKRAAAVFGALDRGIPSKHPEPNADEPSKAEQVKQAALESTVHASYVSPSKSGSKSAQIEMCL